VEEISMNLVDRVKNILLTPKTEWDVIKTETTDTVALYKGYIAILAAIPAVCQTIGMSFIGISAPFVGTYKVGFGSALTSGIVGYALSLASVFIIALIIDALAPTFSGTKNNNRALKTIAYAMTPAWIAGIFSLIPALGIIGFLISLYGLYLLYLGLPKLMESPQEKALGYTIVVIVCSIVVMFVVGIISSVFISTPTPELNISIPQIPAK